jgi:hypothetical protein
MISHRAAYRGFELVFWLARLAGLEPATGCLEGSCSIQLSYRRPEAILHGLGYAPAARARENR